MDTSTPEGLAEFQAIMVRKNLESGGLRDELRKVEAQRDELLAVCEDAIQFVAAWTNNHPCTDGSPSRIGNRVIAKMRTAIAKAKGQ